MDFRKSGSKSGLPSYHPERTLHFGGERFPKNGGGQCSNKRKLKKEKCLKESAFFAMMHNEIKIYF